jgi:hypothetical protein
MTFEVLFMTETILIVGLLSGLVPLISQYERQRVDGVLNQWETESKSLRCLYIETELTIKDRVFHSEQNQEVLFKYRRLDKDSYAICVLRRDKSINPAKDWTPVFLYDGKSLWQFDAQGKRVWGGEYGYKGQGSLQVLWFVLPTDWLEYPFFFYLRCNPTQLRNDYSLRLIKEDDSRLWIQAIPKSSELRKTFDVGQVGLLKQMYKDLPKEFPEIIHWREVNNREGMYRTKRAFLNDESKVSKEDFELKTYSDGWTVERHK